MVSDIKSYLAAAAAKYTPWECPVVGSVPTSKRLLKLVSDTHG
jgi:hypothetical protein